MCFFLVWVCFEFFWGGWVCSFGLFVYLFGGVGFFGGLFVCFYFTATLSAFLLFREELITSYWWGVVHCDLHFFTMTYKSSLAELLEVLSSLRNPPANSEMKNPLQPL